MSAEELPELLGGVLRELVNIDDLRLFTDSLENAVFYRDEPIILGTGMSKLLDAYNELENVLISFVSRNTRVGDGTMVESLLLNNFMKGRQSLLRYKTLGTLLPYKEGVNTIQYRGEGGIFQTELPDIEDRVEKDRRLDILPFDETSYNAFKTDYREITFKGILLLLRERGSSTLKRRISGDRKYDIIYSRDGGAFKILEDLDVRNPKDEPVLTNPVVQRPMTIIYILIRKYLYFIFALKHVFIKLKKISRGERVYFPRRRGTGLNNAWDYWSYMGNMYREQIKNILTDMISYIGDVTEVDLDDVTDLTKFLEYMNTEIVGYFETRDKIPNTITEYDNLLNAPRMESSNEGFTSVMLPFKIECDERVETVVRTDRYSLRSRSDPETVEVKTSLCRWGLVQAVQYNNSLSPTDEMLQEIYNGIDPHPYLNGNKIANYISENVISYRFDIPLNNKLTKLDERERPIELREFGFLDGGDYLYYLPNTDIKYVLFDASDSEKRGSVVPDTYTTGITQEKIYEILMSDISEPTIENYLEYYRKNFDSNPRTGVRGFIANLLQPRLRIADEDDKGVSGAEVADNLKTPYNSDDEVEGDYDRTTWTPSQGAYTDGSPPDLLNKIKEGARDFWNNTLGRLSKRLKFSSPEKITNATTAQLESDRRSPLESLDPRIAYITEISPKIQDSIRRGELTTNEAEMITRSVYAVETLEELEEVKANINDNYSDILFPEVLTEPPTLLEVAAPAPAPVSAPVEEVVSEPTEEIVAPTEEPKEDMTETPVITDDVVLDIPEENPEQTATENEEVVADTPEGEEPDGDEAV